MIALEACAYRIMRLLGVHHPETVELATPDIVKELQHLVEAENAQLKARIAELEEELDHVNGHNFQLIEVMKSASDILNHIRARDGVPYSKDGHRYGISEDYFVLIINAANQCITPTDSFIQNGGNDCPICLKSELNQLKAHNRQLVEFLREIQTRALENTDSPYGFAIWCSLMNPAIFSAPPAQLALAQAEVLRQAKDTVDVYRGYNVSPLLGDLNTAVDAMQEAKGDA